VCTALILTHNKTKTSHIKSIKRTSDNSWQANLTRQKTSQQKSANRNQPRQKSASNKNQPTTKISQQQKSASNKNQPTTKISQEKFWQKKLGEQT